MQICGIDKVSMTHEWCDPDKCKPVCACRRPERSDEVSMTEQTVV